MPEEVKVIAGVVHDEPPAVVEGVNSNELAVTTKLLDICQFVEVVLVLNRIAPPSFAVGVSAPSCITFDPDAVPALKVYENVPVPTTSNL